MFVKIILIIYYLTWCVFMKYLKFDIKNTVFFILFYLCFSNFIISNKIIDSIKIDNLIVDFFNEYIDIVFPDNNINISIISFSDFILYFIMLIIFIYIYFNLCYISYLLDTN
jgi:hypothetical protein